MEQLKQIHVVLFLSEVLLEEVVDGRFEHERVVDGDVANFLDLVPTRLTSSRYRLVHHVVRDEEIGLQLFKQINSAVLRAGCREIRVR
jgi:hypothetical protein